MMLAQSASIFLPILQGSGVITAAQAAPALTYANAVSQGSLQAVTELNSTDSTLEKSTKVTSIFAASISPALPPGTPQQVASTVQGISGALGIFLAQLPQQPPNVKGKIKLPDIQLSRGDKQELAKTVKLAEDTQNRFKLWKAQN